MTAALVIDPSHASDLPALDVWEEERVQISLATARSWLQTAASALNDHREMARDALPEGLSPINDARRSVLQASLVRTMRDARSHAVQILTTLGSQPLAQEHVLSRDAIELACREIDAYISRLPLPPI